MSFRSVLLLGLVLTACSGGDEDGSDAFSACGGDPVAGWDLTEATFEGGAPDTCPDGTVGGFVFFNANGRYSLNADVRAWKASPSDPTCAFTAVWGGFYRQNGTLLCMGDSSAEGDAIPCDDSRPTTSHAVLEYCVEGDELRVRSDHWLNARVPTVLTLRRRP